MTPLAETSLHLVESVEDAWAFQRWLGQRRDVLAFDCETGGLEWWREPLRLVQFGDTTAGWAIPWEDWAGLVKQTFRDYEGEFVGHHAMFDVHFLEVNGVSVPRARVHDTQVQAHLIDPARRVGLKPLADSLIDPRATEGQKALKEGFAQHKWTWRTVPVNFPPYWIYSALDTVLTARLDAMQRPQVQASYAEAYDLEMAVAFVILDMERRGFRVDLDYTRETFDRLDTFTDEMRAYCREAYGVNPTSSAQVTKYLVEQGVQLTERTKTGWKLDEAVLDSIKDKHPLATHVYDIRRAGKFAKSYLRKILDLADGDLIHASVNPLGARTARMSVSDPPLQQLPSDSPLIRDCFIPREGNRLVTCDFDQIEARLLAHFANEPTMIEAIHGGVDLHSFMAARMYGVETPTKQQRKMSKTGTFGKIYGIGVQKFAEQQGVTVGEAKSFLAMFDQTFSAVPSFIRQVETVAQARRASEGTPYVTTPLGRRHPLAAHDGNAYYKLVNYLIQGCAADVLKEKLVALDRAGLGDYLILPVHDEVILDVPADLADEVALRTAEVMEEREAFVVPLTAEAKVMDRWGDPYRAAA